MLAFVIGLLIGFFSAIPTGPVNVAVMLKGLAHKRGQGMMLGAGAGFMEFIYCAVALFGISQLITNLHIELYFKIATFCIFLFFGIKITFFKIPEAKLKKDEDAPGFKRYFILGAALCFSNLALIAYWLTVAGILHGYNIIQQTLYDNLFFSLGTGLGVVIWFFVLLELVEKQKMKLDVKQIEKITRFFGIILLIITTVMGYKLIVEFFQ